MGERKKEKLIQSGKLKYSKSFQSMQRIRQGATKRNIERSELHPISKYLEAVRSESDLRVTSTYFCMACRRQRPHASPTSGVKM